MEAGDTRAETGETQVGGGPCAGKVSGVMTSLGLVAPGGDGGDGR